MSRREQAGWWSWSQGHCWEQLARALRAGSLPAGGAPPPSPPPGAAASFNPCSARLPSLHPAPLPAPCTLPCTLIPSLHPVPLPAPCALRLTGPPSGPEMWPPLPQSQPCSQPGTRSGASEGLGTGGQEVPEPREETRLQRNGQRAAGWRRVFGQRVMVLTTRAPAPSFCRAPRSTPVLTHFVTGDLDSHFRTCLGFFFFPLSVKSGITVTAFFSRLGGLGEDICDPIVESDVK